MTKEAIILAGGFGTRLKKVISEIPKPMAPVAGKPFLEYLLQFLVKQSFSKVVLSVGYKGEVIQNYFGTNFKNLKIEYATEEIPLGTGGAIKYALKNIMSDDVFILNGDSFIYTDLHQFLQYCKTQKSDLGMVVKTMSNFDRYGTISLDNHKIINFKEKQWVTHGTINAGIYYLQKKTFIDLPWPEKFSFEKDFLEKYVGKLHFSAFESKGYFIDIGIPEDYKKAQKELPEQITL